MNMGGVTSNILLFLETLGANSVNRLFQYQHVPKKVPETTVCEMARGWGLTSLPRFLNSAGKMLVRILDQLQIRQAKNCGVVWD